MTTINLLRVLVTEILWKTALSVRGTSCPTNQKRQIERHVLRIVVRAKIALDPFHPWEFRRHKSMSLVRPPIRHDADFDP